LPERLALDTSVLIELIIAGSPYRDYVENLFLKSRRGEVELYVNTVTLAEVVYVAARIYKLAGVRDPNAEAERFTAWLSYKAKIVEVDTRLAKLAGELRKKLGIALPDCFTIALANTINGKALFKRIEREMRDVVEELRKLNVIFLEERY